MARPSGGVLALLSSLLLLLGVRFLRSTAVEKERRGVKMLYFANSGCTGRLAASLAVIGSSGGLFFRLKFRTTTAAAKVRLRARVVSPFEAFLVDVKPAASGNELHGLFTLGETSLSRLDEITVEAIVFTYDFDAENITRNVLLTNETYYYQLRSDDLPVGDARAPSIPALRWRLHDEELAAALRCSRTPDAPTWCIKMPDRLWNMYFTSWYIPPPANELALMQLEPRAPRARLGDDRHVCFFGDSQMRHLFNAFVIATSEYKALPVPGKEVIASNQHTYVQKRWAGFDLGDGRGNISCTDIVANMGQWPAGWPEGRPWSFHVYELGVRADVEEMGALSEQLGLQEKTIVLAVHQSTWIYGREFKVHVWPRGGRMAVGWSHRRVQPNRTAHGRGERGRAVPRCQRYREATRRSSIRRRPLRGHPGRRDGLEADLYPDPTKSQLTDRLVPSEGTSLSVSWKFQTTT